jgi:hypothetical protein
MSFLLVDSFYIFSYFSFLEVDISDVFCVEWFFKVDTVCLSLKFCIKKLYRNLLYYDTVY